ncbi:hypothetical protein G7046_g5781 [Stylonectria norvegica]|nr:hypothetical protein G7046_g5781 [Stylonectria norvegica]
MARAKTRPIQKFAQAVSQCSAEASSYGKCVVADYNAIHQDKCVKEFMRLKNCYLVRSRHLLLFLLLPLFLFLLRLPLLLFLHHVSPMSNRSSFTGSFQEIVVST